jgi:hypothetical protein
MRRSHTAAAIVITLIVGTGIGQHFAHADSVDPTINGCFDSKSGAVRVLVAGSDKCDGATETPLSWNENQVATRWYRDADGDGYGDWYEFVDSPAQPPGYVADNTDCDDNKTNTNPGQTTDPGPGDRNCNGLEAEDRVITWYRDADGDGWGDRSETTRAPMLNQPKGYVYRYGDCNDHNACRIAATATRPLGTVPALAARTTSTATGTPPSTRRDHTAATTATTLTAPSFPATRSGRTSTGTTRTATRPPVWSCSTTRTSWTHGCTRCRWRDSCASTIKDGFATRSALSVSARP